MSRSGRKTLLIVEDEVLLAMSGKAALEKYGYDVILASTGEKAVSAIDGNPGIDLILMDINLGKGMDGTEAAAIILSRHDVPVVFLSSHSEREVVEKTESITSYGYVVKSSSITVLDASIKMAFKLFDANRKIVVANDRLEAIFDALPDLLYEVGLDGQCYASHSTHDTVLYKPLDDLPGKMIAAVLPANISDTILSAIAEAQEKGLSLGKHFEMPVSDGIRMFEITVSRMAGHTEAPRFILLCRDATERNKMEAQLRESETCFRLLFENSKSVNTLYEIVTDAQGIPVDYRYLAVNSAFETLVGMQASDLIGKTLLGMFPATEHYWLDTITEVAVTGVPATMENHSVELNSYTELTVYRPQPGQLAMTSFDITKRKQVETALLKNEATLNAALAASTELIAAKADAAMYKSVLGTVCSLSGARYAAFNVFDGNGLDFSTVAIHGVKEGLAKLYSALGFDLSNKRWPHDPIRAELIRDKTITVFPSLSHLANYVIPGQVITLIERLFKLGEVAVVKVSKESLAVGDFTLFFQQGARIGNTALVELYANQVGMFIVRNRQEKQIERLLAEKDLVLADVHHRIKNNMSMISSLLNLHAANLDDPMAIEALEASARRVVSMNLLYERLYRNPGATEVSTLEYLPALIDDVIENFHTATMVRVSKDIADVRLSARKAQTLGLLINELLVNAMKYAFSGKTSGGISVSAFLEGGMLTVSVQDDGHGLPQTIDFEHSSGFGLRLVQALAMQLDGQARIERGAGTRFVVAFPVS